ncbi:MAG: M28 family peptidase [Anaerolineales bacterium]|nr:M28 family peptidase [Anaerolineales bacterium]
MSAVTPTASPPAGLLVTTFDGQRAYQDIKRQVDFGPRTPDSPGRAELIAWLQDELQQSGWSVEIQNAEQMGFPLQNVIARRGGGRPWIILGAHYDTRLLSDQEPEPADQTVPVPGANDGASGVALLLELGRVLPTELPGGQIWLVFFDAEDNGDIQGRDWILGSRAFVNSLTANPDAAIIVDMIGDRDLEIYLERSSDLELATEIWSTAADLGYSDVFIPLPKYRMLDDHTPFLAAGIPAVLVIDFDYPYWHTAQDTPDKVSAESLQAVGSTLETWLEAQLSP